MLHQTRMHIPYGNLAQTPLQGGGEDMAVLWRHDCCGETCPQWVSTMRGHYYCKKTWLWAGRHRCHRTGGMRHITRLGTYSKATRQSICMSTSDMADVGLMHGWHLRLNTQEETFYHGTRSGCLHWDSVTSVVHVVYVMLVLTHNGRDIVNGPLKFALQCGKG